MYSFTFFSIHGGLKLTTILLTSNRNILGLTLLKYIYVYIIYTFCEWVYNKCVRFSIPSYARRDRESAPLHQPPHLTL